MKRTAGINISGYISKDFGLGVAVRANINAIVAAGIPYVVNDADIDISKEIKEGEYSIENISGENPYPVNLIQINFDNLSRFFSKKGKDYFEGKYNIGFWAWELDSLPDEALIFFKFLDEIWVPSNFCAEVISLYSTIPVVKIMHSIEPLGNLDYNKSSFGIPEDRFVFLVMFDYHSTIDRKNPLGAIDAYEKAFGLNSSEAVLVIKSSISARFPEQKQMLMQRIGNNKSIIVIEEIMEWKKLNGLMVCCDAFVSLHRSEGFGLTIAEAMSVGKPVIATGYSGNIDFMNITNSFPVKYHMISTGDRYYSSTDQNHWAEPDTLHASELMKYVYANPVEIEKIATQAQHDIAANLSPGTIGSKINHRLGVIMEKFSDQPADKAKQLLEFENQMLQQKINALRRLRFVRLKESFKNFQNRVTGKNRKYFWE